MMSIEEGTAANFAIFYQNKSSNIECLSARPYSMLYCPTQINQLLTELYAGTAGMTLALMNVLKTVDYAFYF